MTTATATVTTTATAAAGNYMARVWAIAPGARTANKVHTARNSKRDTMEDARTKVAQKLRDNKAWVLGTAGVDKPDLVYKELGDGKYAVGVKYGNRYFKGMFDGSDYAENVSEENLADLLEAFACDAEAGMFDAYITKIMQANRTDRN